jgi:hypothetical protein
MHGPSLEKVALWLNPVFNPLLVQLPESEYERLKNEWQLPEMPHRLPRKQKQTN